MTVYPLFPLIIIIIINIYIALLFEVTQSLNIYYLVVTYLSKYNFTGFYSYFYMYKSSYDKHILKCNVIFKISQYILCLGLYCVFDYLVMHNDEMCTSILLNLVGYLSCNIYISVGGNVFI